MLDGVRGFLPPLRDVADRAERLRAPLQIRHLTAFSGMSKFDQTRSKEAL